MYQEQPDKKNMKTPEFINISKLPEGTRLLIEGLRIGTYNDKPSSAIMALIHEEMPLDLSALLETMAYISNASVNIDDWYIETRAVFSAKKILASIDFEDDRETAVVIGSNLGTMVLVVAWDPDEEQTSVYAINDDYHIASCIGTLNDLAKPLKKKAKKKKKEVKFTQY